MVKTHHGVYLLITLSLAICHLSLCTAQTRPKVGLVLGGGGAKGAAEVGALRVIEQAGIPIDYIAGTSIGAVVGGLYAAGYHADALDKLFCEQQWLPLLTDRREDLSNVVYRQIKDVVYVFGFPVFYKGNEQIGLLRGAKIEKDIDSLLAAHGCVEFESLRTPFRCVAAELLHANEVVLSKGTLPQAIRASIAIPGIFKPVDIDGSYLTDGGMMNNLPVDVVREMGADIVIAIDLQQEKPADKDATDWGLTGVASLFGLGNLVDWVVSRPDIRKYNANRKMADIYINPPLPDYDASSFSQSKVRQMMNIGEQSARKHWNELLQLKQKLSNTTHDDKVLP